MKAKFIAITVLAVAIAGISCTKHDPSYDEVVAPTVDFEPAGEAVINLIGKVTDKQGKPIAGASINEQIEIALDVLVSIGPVGPDATAWEVLDGGLAKAGGQLVGSSLADGSVAAPAGGVHPLGAVAGSVDVD